MIVWLLMALATLVAGLWLTRPLWRRSARAGTDRRAANVAAFRQRAAEIDRDCDAGLIDTETAGQLRRELETRLVADAADLEVSTAQAPTRRAWLPSLALTMTAVAVALGLYLLSGTWRTAGYLDLAEADPRAAGEASLADAVAGLERRVARHPDDLEAHAELAQVYRALGRYEEAARQFAFVNLASSAQNPDWLVAEGEALALASERNLAGRPRELFEAAAALAPGNGQARWYAGLAALQAQDTATAYTHWNALLRLDLPPELSEVLKVRLAELARSAGIDTGTAPAVADGPVIRLNVSLDPALAAQVKPGDTLFVFARAKGGAPLPLAAYRGLASELPREIALDDSMSMTSAAKLSDHDHWTVTARISRGGQPIAQPGDLQGSRPVGRDELAAPLALVIDQRVP